MRIVLVSINSRFIHSNLAVEYILANFNASATLIHKEFSLKNPYYEMVNDIFCSRPDVLAFSMYIWNKEIILSLIDDLKKLLPSCRIVLAGPEADYRYREMIALASVDYVYRGEGDGAFSSFITALQNKVPLPTYIATKANPEADQNITADLTLLNSPYTSSNIEKFRERLVYYETSRGCPYNCTYCLSSASTGMRFFDTERIEKDFTLFIKAGIKTVKIVDRTFNVPEDRAVEILKIMKKISGELNGHTIFHLEIKPDLISDNLLNVLKELPVDLVQVEMGVQSVQDLTLQAIKRRADRDRIRRIVKELVLHSNIHVHIDVIAGLPYETFDQIQETVNYAMELEPHHLQLGFLKRLEGTELAADMDHEMVFSSRPPYEIYQNKYITFHELSELKKIETVIDRYYNSRRFIHTWRYLLDIAYTDPFSLCKDLANYFETKVDKNASFIPRMLFKYLYDFILSKEFVEKDMLINILAFDYLLQEKPRYFPEWLPFRHEKGLTNSINIEHWDHIRYDQAEVRNEQELRKFLERAYMVYLPLTIKNHQNRYEIKRSSEPKPYLINYDKNVGRLGLRDIKHLEFLA